MKQKIALISIIIPVYNMELYLNRCVDSVLKQSYRNIEVILVDDGSTDRSGIICDQYKNEDVRVKVIHRENGGLSKARNSGLEVAQGEYIGFVDSDDYLAEDMYWCMMEYMLEDVDITCCGRVCVSDEETHEAFCLDHVEKFSQQQALEEVLLLRKMSNSVCTKLFRRELFEGLRFLPGKISEDVPMLYSLLKRARNVFHIGEGKYFNYYRKDSISNKDFYLRRMDYMLFKRDICIDIRKNYPKLIRPAEAGYIQSVLYIVGSICQSSQRKRYYDIEQKLKKVLRNNFLRGMMNPYLDWKTKKAVIIMGFVDKI